MAQMQFKSTTAQTFSSLSNETFHNLVLDNTNNLALNSSLTVASKLTFNNGQIITGANTLSIGNGGSVL